MRKEKFAPGEIYHIYNRGNNKRLIFHEERDKWRFLQGMALFNYRQDSSSVLSRLGRKEHGANMGSLKEFVDRERSGDTPLVNIMADCLMPNHFHLLLQEVEKKGISEFMQRLGTAYVSFYNNKYDNSGSLFQGPFKAVRIDSDSYLQHILAYINVLNPGQLIEPNLKKEGPKNIDEIMEFAKNYQWSTNPEYLQTRNSFFITKGILGEIFPDANEYETFVRTFLENKQYEQISKLTID